jgi:glycosyltransferase involved in cell wall biosynthesis
MREETRSLINEEWYLQRYPELAGKFTSAAEHYLSVGWAEGRQPNHLFHTEWYFAQNPEVEASGTDPLTHYLEIGWRNGRSPHPLFEQDYYLQQNPDIATLNAAPLLHYLQEGWREKRRTHPLFDPVWYRRAANLPENADALKHYLTERESSQRLSTHLLFDGEWYCRKYPASVRSDPVPLCDYVIGARKLGRSPHPLFDTEWYLDTYPDIRDAGIDPLVHYIRRGAIEDRNPNMMFDSKWYLETYPDVARARMHPLEHYVRSGEREGRNPSRRFNTEFYKSTLSASQAARFSPLAHYLERGRLEGKPTQVPPVMTLEGHHFLLDHQPNIVLVAHAAPRSGQFFGAERSLVDMVTAIATLPYNLHVVLPNRQREYETLLLPHCAKIHITPYKWRSAAAPQDLAAMESFKRIFADSKADLVYANTIMLHEPLAAARFAGIRTAVHCRELINADEELTHLIGDRPEAIVEAVQRDAEVTIANSKATAKLFGGEGRDEVIIPNVVPSDLFTLDTSANGEKLRVGIISSNSPKKGLSDFLAIAESFSQSPELQFSIFGPDNEHLRKLMQEQAAQIQTGSVRYAGYAKTPVDALSQLDIVLSLSNFAESFGRTVAEAMAAGKIVIAYDAGAVGELIEDGKTGFLISSGDIEGVARRIEAIKANPERFADIGTAARKFILENHSINSIIQAYKRVLPDLFVRSQFVTIARKPKTTKKLDVTVIIPNYNYQQYLGERIQSVLRQTVRPKEIIFLDDCSSDSSVEVAGRELEASNIPYTIIENATNAGVYAQWRRGAMLASSEWIWIAEADDTCAPNFLERLSQHADKETNLVYCQSKKIDGDGALISADNLAHTNDVDKQRWLIDYQVSGVREVVDALAFRNVIPNVSATLLRAEKLRSALGNLKSLRFCGDWQLYADMLRSGKVAFVAEPLNSFRRHVGSVTRQNLKTEAYLQELAQVHAFVCKHFPILEADRQKMLRFLDKDFKIDGVPRNSTAPSIADKIGEAAEIVSQRKHFAFITTNNGSFFGGSEMLWREAAEMLRFEGDAVSVLIKRWTPTPDFIQQMQVLGIKVLYKEEDGFESLIASNPDLVVVSLGDQDEGTEYFDRLKLSSVPYVIVNQLTKEPRFWPIRPNKTEAVAAGYQGAKRVFFTCRNNWKVMEERLQRPLPNADIHFNPYHIDRDIVPAWPSEEDGIQIAIPSKLLFIHKGQDLVAEAVKSEVWRTRNVFFNFYGIGPDEENLRGLARKYGIRNFRYHGRVPDIGEIWKTNHALLMPSRMEGLPIMLVSAALSGRPMIVTDIGGHSELTEDGITGFLAPNPSVEDVSAAMERAWQALPDWQQMGLNARSRVLSFLPEDPVRHFLEQISTVLAS